MAPRTRSSTKTSEKIAESDVIPGTSDAVETTNTPVQDEPVSPSGKRKSAGDVDNSNDDDGAPSDQEATSPKRQRLAVRTRDDQSTEKGRKTYLEVEIPSSATPKWPRSSAVPDSQDVDGLSESDPEAEPSSASKQLEEEASQKLASQSVEPDRSPVPKPKSKHIVFGDDDDVEKFVAAAAATESNKKTENGDAKDEEEGSGDDDDDDDAPEAVSTQAVAKEMQKAALAASEAAEKQAASLKRKRQEKDSLYKQQAERRKRARGTVEVHQKKANSKDEASSDEEDDGVAEVETAVTTGRRRAQKFNLPAVLPAEFLTDSSEDEDEDESALKRRVVKKPKKINFETGGKRPRDQVVGSTRFRVLADQADQKLAPRVRKQARVSKESLLRRKRSGAVVGAGTKKAFFVRR
ncbi:hypothetical protein M434DRAFT_36240 [Hypoxylon sp. CO27-5]|nr:hypothetical protein M434DRAFT_36240 [Hypoxylon sp. CO27-5]